MCPPPSCHGETRLRTTVRSRGCVQSGVFYGSIGAGAAVVNREGRILCDDLRVAGVCSTHCLLAAGARTNAVKIASRVTGACEYLRTVLDMDISARTLVCRAVSIMVAAPPFWSPQSPLWLSGDILATSPGFISGILPVVVRGCSLLYTWYPPWVSYICWNCPRDFLT